MRTPKSFAVSCIGMKSIHRPWQRQRPSKGIVAKEKPKPVSHERSLLLWEVRSLHQLFTSSGPRKHLYLPAFVERLLYLIQQPKLSSLTRITVSTSQPSGRNSRLHEHSVPKKTMVGDKLLESKLQDSPPMAPARTIVLSSCKISKIIFLWTN